MRRVCSVSVDLDPLACYYRIHGLGEPPRALADVVLRRALPRWLELFARRGIQATLFVVGGDLDGNPHSRGSRALIGEAARAGHELGNHSFGHPYDLDRLPRERVAEEIDRAHERIAEAGTVAPVGFRAPGYNLSPTIVDVLIERGYRYDSSILPAPLYWSAKAAIMTSMRLLGRPSGSALGDPRLAAAPLVPYRPAAGAPWRRGQASLVELPMSVSPSLRLPLIGTSVMLAPPWLRGRLLDSVRARPFFNFELHGIDLIDAEADGIPAELVARQPDLRASLVDKRRALEATLDRLALDYRFAPLRDVAAETQRKQ